MTAVDIATTQYPDTVAVGENNTLLPKANSATSYLIPTPLIIGAVATLSLISPLAYALSIALVNHHPLIAVILTPNEVFVSLTASRIALPTLLVLATLRLTIASPFHYMLGKRAVEHKAVKPPKLLKRLRKTIIKARQSILSRTDFQRYGLLIIFAYPVALTMIPAGALKLPKIRVSVANLLGKLTRLILMIYLGPFLPWSAILHYSPAHLL